MNNYDKLISILREIFQIDQADLDFGIYRIMNQKRGEIDDFLQNKLVPQVKEVLEQANLGDATAIKTELEEAMKGAKALGVDPDHVPKVKELRARLQESQPIELLEEEVFSHLTSFFKRYYDNGDFISMRRYKKDVYAIPYEGEEVKLHWANHDQYYIKSSEYLKNYQFKIDKSKNVRFELVEASTERDNNKATEGKERYFRIYEDKPLEAKENTLTIYFTYLPGNKKDKREALNAQAFEVIKSHLPKDWLADVLAKSPSPSNPDRTLLEKHLNDFTALNTFDYFIHKDLGGFLRRELDFYIKNEVLSLDNLSETIILRSLTKVKALRTIAEKIITFLAQLEDFQKRLWLKKKFVIETNYCITLDRIPESYFEEISNNDAQWEEWERLFVISEIPQNLFQGGANRDRFSIIKNQPYLVLDTQFFSEDFKYRLLAEFEDLDEEMDGLMINSENFQALNFIKERYRNTVRAIYIDPPYNTVHSKILYKNQFEHSSWLSLIHNTTPIIPYIWQGTHSFAVAIDDYELPNLLAYLKSIMIGHDISVVVVNHHPQGSGGKLSRTHEYLIVCTNSDSPNLLGEPLEAYQEDRSFMRSGTGENNYRYGRWKSFYALLIDPKTKKIVDVEDPVLLDQEYPVEDTVDGLKRVYPINSRGEERVWRSSYLTGRERARNDELFVTTSGAIKQRIDHEQKRKVLFSNWIDPIYNAGTHGSELLSNLNLDRKFDYPKSIHTLVTSLWAQTFGDSDAVILDYFAGSGTTGHAVINLNRQDKGKRKYLLVEMGEYFNSVTKPRIQKVIYSEDWKDGKPVSRKGSSHIFKYIKLESYEDTLNNLRLVRNEAQEGMLAFHDQFQEEYMLGYMLDTEAKGSLLSVEDFREPFSYQLNITQNNESAPTRIDLVETFNYLIGLHVENIRQSDGFRVVTGKSRKGEKVLVIWRNIEEKPNDILNTFFETQGYHEANPAFDHIYVNGACTLETLQTETSTWQVHLLEAAFLSHMFETQDV